MFVAELVPDRLGYLLYVARQMILAGTIKPGLLVDVDQGLAVIPEGIYSRLPC